MVTNIDVTLRDGGYRNAFEFSQEYAIEHADMTALQDLLKRAGGRLRPMVALPTQWVMEFLEAATTRSGRLAFQMLATVVAAGDAVLATGHVPARHLPSLLRDVAGTLAEVPIIVTHAFHPMIEVRDVADELLGTFEVYLEHTELTRRLRRISEEEHQSILCEQDRLSYASDFGQIGSPTVAAWRKESRILFDSLGLDAGRRHDITLGNASNALVRPF